VLIKPCKTRFRAEYSIFDNPGLFVGNLLETSNQGVFQNLESTGLIVSGV